MNATHIINELQSVGTAEKAAHLQRFFKTGPGQYGEGDVFIGVVVPQIRSIAKANLLTPEAEIRKLLMSEFHEARLCVLLILVERFKKAPETKRHKIYSFYLKNESRINNWDLVDLSCPTIIGEYLVYKKHTILYKLAKSGNLWEQRIAIVSTIAFIRMYKFQCTLELAKILMNHRHDLIHKAAGWMLREIGKRIPYVLTTFLEEHAATMPRTMLRYAIERYPEAERLHFLKKKQRSSGGAT